MLREREVGETLRHNRGSWWCTGKWKALEAGVEIGRMSSLSELREGGGRRKVSGVAEQVWGTESWWVWLQCRHQGKEAGDTASSCKVYNLCPDFSPRTIRNHCLKVFKYREQGTRIAVALLNGHFGCNWKNAMCRVPFETRGNVSRPFRKWF